MQEPGSPRRIIASATHRLTATGSRRYDATAYGPDNATARFFFEIEGALIPPREERRDFLVLALVFYAMRQGCDLHVEGAVSRQLLINLEEFQRAWSMWVPQTYRPIRITATEEVEDRPVSTERVGVAAFSGGVDATFALVRHVTEREARDRCRVAAAVLVHGFDVDLEQDVAFAKASENASEMTAALNVPLSIVRTDWKDLADGYWEHEHLAGLSACLALFSGVASFALMGADQDYRSVGVPWGSNSITNHLLSSASFRNLTTGASFSRTKKVAAIARIPAIASRLRVCWEGPQTGENCGKCEKCMRTKLNFLANGLEVPPGLGRTPTIIDILRVKARRKEQIGFLRDIYLHAQGSSLSRATKRAIRVALIKNRILQRLPAANELLRVLKMPWKLARRTSFALGVRVREAAP
jgi:hypothetical protein